MGKDEITPIKIVFSMCLSMKKGRIEGTVRLQNYLFDTDTCAKNRNETFISVFCKRILIQSDQVKIFIR